ncbi:MAG: hypothetical protein OHK0015_46890 [Chloroflexi bacterium OHK40]
MGHPFGDLLSQYLHRKHGLSQSRLAEGILQAPTVITAMCKGRRLTGPRARERVVAIIGWLQQQGALRDRAEADALLNAARMAPLQLHDRAEAALIHLLPERPEQRHPIVTAPGYDAPLTHRQPNPPLPAPFTPFVGRVREMEDLTSLLSDPAVRLVTLLGPGGIGKTRLAVEVATTLHDRFPHGVHFISLAGVDTAYAIIALIADALNVSFHADGAPYQQLCDYLRLKHLLLVLDNFEHLIDAPPPTDAPELQGTTLVYDLLHAAPQLKILVTSRSRIRLQGEQLYALNGIDIPQDDGISPADARRSSAVALFVQSARRVRADFDVTDDNVAAVVQICRLVQGMPLAILLATSWVAVLSPTEIALELGRYDATAQGLDFLETDLRDFPARQRSMRAVFDHSWGLLTELAQQLFVQLSLFHNGFTRTAAEAVVDVHPPNAAIWCSRSNGLRARPDPPPVSIAKMLRDLVNTSLLQVEGEAEGRRRYTLHELARQYAVQRLAQTPDRGEGGRERHCLFYCTLLSAQEARLKGAHSQAALAEIDPELDNVRAAWRWAIAHTRLEWLARSMNCLGLFYERRNRYQEGAAVYGNVVQQLRATANETPVARQVVALALVWQGTFARLLGRLAESEGALQQSLDVLEQAGLPDDEQQSIRALLYLQQGRLYYAQADFTKGEAAFRQALLRSQALSDTWGEANVLLGLGSLAYRVGDLALARAHYEASLARYRSLGDDIGYAHGLERLGDIFRDQGQFEAARQLTLEAIGLYERLKDRAKTAYGQLALGMLHMYMGRFHEAYTVIQLSAAIFDELALTPPFVDPLASLATINLELGRYRAASSQLEVYLAKSRSADRLDAVALGLMLLAYLALVEARYVDAERLASESKALFAAINDQERVALVRACQGYAVRRLGKPDIAERHFSEALQFALANHSVIVLISALPGIALLLADQGKGRRAVEVYAQMSSLEFVTNSQLRRDLAGAQLEAIAATLPPEVAAMAQASGSSGDMWATAAALAAELSFPSAPLDRPGTEMPIGRDGSMRS